MRLLVTRPQPDADLTAERLRALGHDVWVSPVLETRYSKEPLEWRDGMDLVVTSRNGMRALEGIADTSMKQDARIFTVGDATAQLAKDMGFQKTISASGNVDDLVEILSQEAGEALLYVCGKDRRGDLEGRLALRGRKISIAERYEARFLSSFSTAVKKAFKNQEIQGVLHYSKRSAEAWKSLSRQKDISHSTNKIVHFCLAKNIISVFDGLDKRHIWVAKEPNESSLFDGITEFCKGLKS